MRKRIIFATVLSIISTMPHASNAVECDNKLSESACKAMAGCGYAKFTGCNQCSQGSWSDDTRNCELCPTGYRDNPDTGAISQQACKKKCPIERLKNSPGQIAPNNEFLNYDGTPKTCEYTELTNITCDDGYHTTTATVSTGADGNLINIGNLCIANTMACSATGLAGCIGTIVGNATWDTDAKKWNYTDCRCQQQVDSMADTYGIIAVECGYKSGTGTNTQWSDSCTQTGKIIACNAGYYLANENDKRCTAAGIGYYADGASKERTKCPAPSTTDKTTATSVKDCYIKGGKKEDGGTKFCDKNGCFYLPSNLKMYHK